MGFDLDDEELKETKEKLGLKEKNDYKYYIKEKINWFVLIGCLIYVLLILFGLYKFYVYFNMKVGG